MALFSGWSEDAQQFEGKGTREFNTGTVDDDLDMIMEYIGEQVSQGQKVGLKDAIEQLKSMGLPMRDYEMYAGRLMSTMRDAPDRDKKAEQLGIPSFQEMEGMNLADRVMQGGAQEWLQILYGAGAAEKGMAEFFGPEGEKGVGSKVLDYLGGEGSADFWQGMVTPYDERTSPYSDSTKGEVQEQRKAKVAQYKSNEKIWKSFNATTDLEEETGLDIPWNLGGVAGEMIPGMILGGIGAKMTTGAGQVLYNIGTNTGLEAAKYQEHGDTMEAGLGIAAGGSEFLGPIVKKVGETVGRIPVVGGAFEGAGNLAGGILEKMPAFDPVTKGSRFVNWLDFKNKGIPYASKQGISKNEADRGYNLWNMVTKGELDIPYVWLDRNKQVLHNINEETFQEPISVMTNQLNKINKKAGGLYDKALENMGPGAKEMTEAGFDGDYPAGDLMMQKIQALKQQFTEAGDPYREAFEEAGNNINVDSAALFDMSKNQLVDSSSIAHLNRAIKNVTKRETQYSSAAKQRMDEVTSGMRDAQERINAYYGTNKDLGKQQKLLAQEKDLLEDKWIELRNNPDASTKAIEAAKNAFDRKQYNMDKVTEKIGTLNKGKAADNAQVNANQLELDSMDSDGGVLDLDNLTATQFAEVMKQVNTARYGGSDMLGEMSDNVKRELGDWYSKAQKTMHDLPEEFSVPYKKAKGIEKRSIDMFKGNSKIKDLGKIMSLKGPERLEKLQKLFEGEPTNLKLAKEFLSSDDPALLGMIRHNIEQRVGPSPLKSTESGQRFDFKGFADAFKDVDFDDYRSLVDPSKVPGTWGPIDGISGLAGWQTNVGAPIGAINDAVKSSGAYKHQSTGSQIGDILRYNDEAFPYSVYEHTDPLIIDRARNFTRKMKPSGYTDYHMGPETQKDSFNMVLKDQPAYMEGLEPKDLLQGKGMLKLFENIKKNVSGGSSTVEPIPDASGLDILQGE